MNIGEYCPEKYIILRECSSAIWYTARDNIHAITLLLYSNKYFFFRSVINTVNIWFFHISLLYCTRKNILIFALFLSHDNWWSRDNLILRLSFRSDCRRWWSLSVKRNIRQFDYNYSLFDYNYSLFVDL